VVDVYWLISQWRVYANANKVRAEVLRKEGDFFGMELCLARGEVRQHAAELLRRMAGDPQYVAKEMHDSAKALWQHTLPLIGFDEAALKYTRARTWQDCARAIDPGLPVVQPKLLTE
jgi:hypothetical protein